MISIKILTKVKMDSSKKLNLFIIAKERKVWKIRYFKYHIFTLKSDKNHTVHGDMLRDPTSKIITGLVTREKYEKKI